MRSYLILSLLLAGSLGAMSHGGGHSSGHSSHPSHSTPHVAPHVSPHINPHVETHVYIAPHPYVRPYSYHSGISTEHIILYWLPFRPHTVSPSGSWAAQSSCEVDWTNVGWLAIGTSCVMSALGLSVWLMHKL